MTNANAKAFALQLRIVGGRANRRARMPKARPPNGVERDYGEALGNYLESRVKEAFAPLFDALPNLLARVQTRQDAGEEQQLLAIIESARKSLDRSVSQADITAMAEAFGRQTSAHQRAALNRQVRATFGVDIPVLTDRRMRSRLEAFAHANAALIRDIAPALAHDIGALVVQAVESGTLHKTLAADLETRIGLVRKRARLIARDQIGKLYGQVSKIRHEELGISAFIWRSVGDRRVRGTPKALHGKYPHAKPSHYLRNGVRYTYADPPKGRDGKPEIPGQPTLCRCYPDPDFNGVLDELEALEAS